MVGERQKERACVGAREMTMIPWRSCRGLEWRMGMEMGMGLTGLRMRVADAMRGPMGGSSRRRKRSTPLNAVRRCMKASHVRTCFRHQLCRRDRADVTARESPQRGPYQ
eukprot:Rmarinus@m.1152